MPSSNIGRHVEQPRRFRSVVASVLGIALAFGSLAFGAPSCSVVVDADRQQSAAAKDCENRGLGPNAECRASICVAADAVTVDSGADADAAEEDPMWGCLGNVRWPEEEPAVAVGYAARFEGAITQQAMPGLPVRGCRVTDPDCAAPVAGPAATDAEGIVQLSLYSGFRGFLDIQPTEAFPSLMPSRLYALPIPDKAVGTRPGGRAETCSPRRSSNTPPVPSSGP